MVNNLDKLKDIEILECAQVILNFLTDDTDRSKFSSFNEITSFQNMNIVLKKYNTDMTPFTFYLNSKYRMNEKLWDKSPKEFFSSKKGHDFYKMVIRDLKLKLCLS